MFWCGPTRGSPFATALAKEVDLEWTQAWPHYVLKLEPTWELFKKTRKRNIKESLRHCYNSLKRDGIEFQFDVAEDPQSTARASRLLPAPHVARRDGGRRSATSIASSTPSTRKFLEAVIARLSAVNVAKIFTLTINGQVVAARIGFVVGDSCSICTIRATTPRAAQVQHHGLHDHGGGAPVGHRQRAQKQRILSGGHRRIPRRGGGRARSSSRTLISARDYPWARAAYTAYKMAVDSARQPHVRPRGVALVLGKRNWE